MITPYFNAWILSKKDERSKLSMIKGFRDTWPVMKPVEKISLLLFLIYDLALLVFGIVVVFNVFLLPVYVVCLVILLIMTAGVAHVAASLHRRVPELSATRTVEFVKLLQRKLQKSGIKNPKQIEYVRDEAIRLLERKERSKATTMRYAVDIVVLLALAAVVNLLIELLKESVAVDMVLVFLVAAVFVSATIVLLVYAFWWIYDSFDSLPLPKLHAFICDLTTVLVLEMSVPSSSRVVRKSMRRHRPHRQY